MEKNRKYLPKKTPNKLPREIGLVASSMSSQGEKRYESLMIIY